MSGDSNQKSLLFTDGACSGNPGPGGWAYVALSPDKTVKEGCGHQASTTNNQMELLAIIEGLSFLSQKSQEEIFVFTDSVYAIRGIQQWVHGWKKNGWKTKEGKPVLNQELWERLDTLRQKLNRSEVRIQWQFVRGHSGTPGNERCDELSRLCSQKYDPLCFEGPVDNYAFDLFNLPSVEPLPEFKPIKKQSSEKPIYLSLIDGILKEHASWSDCEARVKGRSGARFKKIQNQQERQETLTKWGFKNG